MFAKIFCKHEVVCIGVQDMIKFGHSTREYVLLHAQSNAWPEHINLEIHLSMRHFPAATVITWFAGVSVCNAMLAPSSIVCMHKLNLVDVWNKPNDVYDVCTCCSLVFQRWLLSCEITHYAVKLYTKTAAFTPSLLVYKIAHLWSVASTGLCRSKDECNATWSWHKLDSFVNQVAQALAQSEQDILVCHAQHKLDTAPRSVIHFLAWLCSSVLSCCAKLSLTLVSSQSASQSSALAGSSSSSFQPVERQTWFG